MSLIAETLKLYLPPKRKQTPSGWISFNAVCCPDKRQRGGFIVNDGDAVTYHCFNCGFKASWQPGRQLSKSMKQFMHHLHIPDDTISKLSFEAIKLLNEQIKTIDNIIIPTFDKRELPLNAKPITNYINDAPTNLIPVLEYINSRGLFLEDYEFYWTPNIENRLIIPYFYQHKIVGYTARTIDNNKTRYIAEQQPGFVFNLDNQYNDRKFVFVCEGPFDAISIDGCALLGSEIKDQQNWLLQQLHKEIVLIPDKDIAGRKVIKQALEYGWAVAIPDYPPGVKDINDCVIKLGRLATLFLVVNSIQSSPLKIQLTEKYWFNN